MVSCSTRERGSKPGQFNLGNLLTTHQREPSEIVNLRFLRENICAPNHVECETDSLVRLNGSEEIARPAVWFQLPVPVAPSHNVVYPRCPLCGRERESS